MKRNKSKAKKNEKPKVQKNVELNSHDALCSELVKQGFDRGSIDRAIEEMWDLQLDYSNFNAIVSFMSERPDRKDPPKTELESMPLSAPTDGKTPTIKVTETELNTLKTTSTSSTSAPSQSSAFDGSVTLTMASEHQKDAVPETVTSQEDQGTGSSLSDPTHSQLITAIDSSPRMENGHSADTKRAPKLSALQSKLGIVAQNDNLMDAIVALTEWVVKAASPKELKELCNNNAETSALRTIIHRSIVTTNTRNVSGQLLDLIGSILRKAGIPSTNLSSSAKALGYALRKAHAVISADDSFRQSVADSVSDSVISNIRKALEQLIPVSETVSDSVGQLDAEIKTVKSLPLPKCGGVMGLMAKRDQNKSLADKYSTIIGIKLRTVSEMKHASSPVGEDKDASNNLLDLMLGVKSEAVRKSQASYNSLKNRQVGLDSNLTEREEITKVIETMQADKSKISSQMEVLKLELEKLSAEERKVSDEINAAEGKLAGLDTSLSIEAKEINAQLRDASENIKIGESVSEAVTSLQTFESELAKATSSLVSPTPTAPPNAVSLAEAGNRMNAYVEVMSNYFRAELNMVTFMKQRARSLQVRIPDLEREIQECKSLQMSMNVADLTKTLMDIKQNVSDDNDIARALKTEAEAARSILVERLEQYKSTVPNAHSSSTALIAIRDITSELGLSFDKRFNSLVE